jgi:hypothetical protein
MNLLSFIKAIVGKNVQSIGGLGGQCVDLCNVYLKDVRGQPSVFANAVDWRMARINGMTWTPNGALNFPDPGAIVVWGEFLPHAINSDGHVAVAIASNSMVLISFDQDWPVGAPSLMTAHDYGGVLGWHNPTP